MQVAKGICKCDYCGKSVDKKPSHVSAHNFCNLDCYTRYREATKLKLPSGLYEFTCQVCGKAFQSKDRRVTCSQECLLKRYRQQHEKKRLISDEEMIALYRANVLTKDIAKLAGCANVTVRKVLREHYGIQGHRGRWKKTPEMRAQISKTLTGRYRGSKNPAWKGTSPIVRVLRGYFAQMISPLALQRDDYTCLRCGKRGGELNAHHKVPFIEIVEALLAECDKVGITEEDAKLEFIETHPLFTDLDNLITTCEKCHYSLHGRQYRAKPRKGKV